MTVSGNSATAPNGGPVPYDKKRRHPYTRLEVQRRPTTKNVDAALEELEADRVMRDHEIPCPHCPPAILTRGGRRQVRTSPGRWGYVCCGRQAREGVHE
jgi:hypothetical protein